MSVPSIPQRPDFSHHLTLAGHLEELRRRLAIGLAALCLGIGISATQAERLMRWLQQPAQPYLTRFAFFSPTEPLLAYLKVAVLAALTVSMPVLLWQLWAFVRTGLTIRERHMGLALAGWGSALFVGGAAFGYAILVPVSLRVLLSIGRDRLEPVISIDTYLSFVSTLLLWCGVIFELPIVLWLLAKVGVVTPEWLRQQRPYAILVLVILAAIITPTTDPVNLLLMSCPLIVLYEVSIHVAKCAGLRREPGGDP